MNKQIEEMANFIHRTEFVDISRYEEETIAKELLKHYQPKLPEDSVVLTRSEHQKYLAYKLIEPQIKGCLDRERELEKVNAELKLEIQKAHHKGVRVGFDLTKYKENSIEQARKETAREILHKIYEQLSKYEAVNEIDYDCWVDDVLYEITKQYGVNLGEEQ